MPRFQLHPQHEDEAFEKGRILQDAVRAASRMSTSPIQVLQLEVHLHFQFSFLLMSTLGGRR